MIHPINSQSFQPRNSTGRQSRDGFYFRELFPLNTLHSENYKLVSAFFAAWSWNKYPTTVRAWTRCVTLMGSQSGACGGQNDSGLTVYCSNCDDDSVRDGNTSLLVANIITH